MNMICFDKAELRAIFEAPSRKQLRETVLKDGHMPIELLLDETKMREIAEKIKIINDKEENEIFCALYVFPEFYKKESKICFLLKDGIDPRKEQIDSLKKLKISLKENDLTDFLLWHDDGVRAYQLKSYRGKTEINDFLKFLEEKLLHYSNDLGETNLLINLQSEGDLTGDFFQDVHEKLKKLKVRGTGHVIISYNEENKFDVMVTVYPILGTTRIPQKS